MARGSAIDAPFSFFFVSFLFIISPDAFSIPARAVPRGQIRVVEIPGLDLNMCCGTHVPNVAVLQAIKMMAYDTKGGNVRVHYVAGQRVLDVNSLSLSPCYACV